MTNSSAVERRAWLTLGARRRVARSGALRFPHAVAALVVAATLVPASEAMASPPRDVVAHAQPAEIDVGGRSVALEDAAHPDPESVAQSDVGGTMAATPLRSSPLRSRALPASPLSGSPLRGSPLRSGPLGGSPLQTSPLTEIPLRSSGGWTAALHGTSLQSVPLQSLTLGDVLDLTPIPTVTLGDLDPTRGMLRRTSVASLLLLGRPFDALPPPGPGSWCDYLASVGPSPRCGAGGVDPASTDTLDLELLGVDLRSYWHRVPIVLTAGVLGSGTLTAPLSGIPLQAVDLAATPLGRIRQEQVNDAIGCTTACDTTLGARQGAEPASFDGVTLGDLLASARASTGLAQLFTLQQLLPGIVPASELSPEEAPALDALIQRASTNASRLALGASFSVGCGEIFPPPPGGDGLTVAITAPKVGYVPGSGTLTASSQQRRLVDPVDSGDTLTFRQFRDASGVKPLSDLCAAATAGTEISAELAFDAEPPTGLGTVAVTPTVATGSGLEVTGEKASFDVVEGSDPPGDAGTTTALQRDRLYTGYLPSAGDVDAYRIPAPAAGSVVTVSLSNVPVDEDLFVQGPKVGIPVPSSRRRAQSAAPIMDVPVPDQSVDLNGDDDTSSPDGSSGMPMSAASLATLPLRGVSNRPGTANESVSFVVRGGDVGSDYIATVAAGDGASSKEAYGIRVTVTPPADEPACIPARAGLGSGTTGTFPSSIPSATQTLILWDRQRTEAAYPGSGATLAGKLATLAGAPGVAGAVIPVESDPTHGAAVRGALAAWDADPCSPDTANDVVGAIGRVVDRLRPALPQLRHIVIVGGDDLLPQARVVDLVGTANEREQADAMTAAGHDTPVSRTLRDGLVLSDDPYGDFDPQAWLTGSLAVPDVGLGRLVETPAEIGAQIDQYVAAGGVLPAGTARITGYDFLADGAGSVRDSMQALVGAANVGSRIDATWSATDALAYINRAGGGITSINARYDHYHALAPNGGSALSAADASPAPGSLLFTIGSHAGLESVNAYGVAGDPGLDDWTSRLTRGGSVFAGNTGFAYGDSADVAYSERLVTGFASQLATRASTAGQALMYAKQQYFATLGVPGVYDGKGLQEATFYGLPMYRVSTTGGLGAPALPSGDPSGSTTVSRTSFDVRPELGQATTARGSYWTADGRDPIVSHFRPIQPRTDLDVTPADDAVVHGVLITALASTDVTGVNPVLSRPTVDLAANEPEVGPRAVAFPATLQRVQEYAAADGRHVQLNLAAGQFIADPADQLGRGTQRLFNRIAGDVLRSRSTDFDPPRVTQVDFAAAGGTVTFDVTSPDTDVASGLALYQDSAGVWHDVALAVSGGRVRGSGPLTGDPQAPRAFIQLVDAAGNVAIASGKGGGVAPSSADTVAPETTITSAAPALIAAGGSSTITWHADSDGTFSVRVGGASCSTGNEVDGGGYSTAPADRTSTVTGAQLAEGANTIRVCVTDAAGNSGSDTTTITKDTVAPVVAVVSASPVLVGAGGSSTVTWNADGNGAFSVRVGGTSCSTGNEVASGSYTTAPANRTSSVTAAQLSEGANTVRVCVTDAAGNSGSDTKTVTRDTVAPTVTCSANPSTLKGNSHKLAAITTTVNVSDGGSGPAGFQLVSVLSNQADSGLGGGDVPNDIQGWVNGTADTSGQLRTERGSSDRVYTFTYRGRDVAGNTANCVTMVTSKK